MQEKKVNKLTFVGAALALSLAAPAATAANPQQGLSPLPQVNEAFKSTVKAVYVVDATLYGSNTGAYLRITFPTPQPVCGTTAIDVWIPRAEHPEQFDHWVRLAESAFVSGKQLFYGSARRTTSAPCYTWFVALSL